MKIEESIRIEVAREEKPILSKFELGGNRYYHDLHIGKFDTIMIHFSQKIDAIMIRMGGESILSRFANLEKNQFESINKIDENRDNRFESICQWGIDVNRFFGHRRDNTYRIVQFGILHTLTILYINVTCVDSICLRHSVYSCLFYV